MLSDDGEDEGRLGPPRSEVVARASRKTRSRRRGAGRPGRRHPAGRVQAPLGAARARLHVLASQQHGHDQPRQREGRHPTADHGGAAEADLGRAIDGPPGGDEQRADRGHAEEQVQPEPSRGQPQHELDHRRPDQRPGEGAGAREPPAGADRPHRRSHQEGRPRSQGRTVAMSPATAQHRGPAARPGAPRPRAAPRRHVAGPVGRGVGRDGDRAHDAADHDHAPAATSPHDRHRGVVDRSQARRSRPRRLPTPVHRRRIGAGRPVCERPVTGFATLVSALPTLSARDGGEQHEQSLLRRRTFNGRADPPGRTCPHRAKPTGEIHRMQRYRSRRLPPPWRCADSQHRWWARHTSRRHPAKATAAHNTTGLGATISLVPGQPGGHELAQGRARSTTSPARSQVSPSFTVHDHNQAMWHNGAARTVPTTVATAVLDDGAAEHGEQRRLPASRSRPTRFNRVITGAGIPVRTHVISRPSVALTLNRPVSNPGHGRR